MSFKADVEKVRDALRALRLLGLNHRRGGLQRQLTLAREALEALERIEKPQKEIA